MTLTILETLQSLQDEVYRDFQARLMPNIAPERILGVRTPQLRALAKQYKNTPEAEVFLKSLPHKYYEENNLHAFLIEQRRNFEQCLAEVNAFLPYIDNWATCDSLSPKVFGRHLPALLEQIPCWLADGHTYTIRFGIEMLMRWFLDAQFLPAYLQWVSAVVSEEYYVKMMIAWYFATALAKQYNATVPYLEQHRLPEWTHKKTIRKAIESYRITEAQKAYLRTL